ncbi:uncharacterized protein LOC143325007 isoform X2 [Chaetodon auriga]|uniref:uncharacterized protein LOC143325007 isoform X2 n=1 Tax=Chaetodon auriga TaxID=39042 RepID=UPI004032FDB7
MKAHCVLAVAIVVSVAMMGVMQVRKKEFDKVDKRNSFEDIKLRVTNDVLGEYLDERGAMQNALDKTTNEHRALEKQVNMIKTKEDTTKGEVLACEKEKKSASDELGIIETEFSNLKVAINRENASWVVEMETLHKQLQARSPVCDFLKKNSQAVSLCGKQVNVEAPKQEEAKAEAAKQGQLSAKEEELSAEAPKQENPEVVVLKTR